MDFCSETTSYGTDFNEKIGQKDRAQLILTQPQIINGGQTAFTLSRLYEQFVVEDGNKQIFDNKEVLLKVITFPEDQASQDAYLKLIQSISRATNQQSQVNEGDAVRTTRFRYNCNYFAYRCFLVLKEIKKGLAKDKTDKFGVHRYGSGPQFGMYAIVAVCRSQFGAAGYDGDPNDIVESVLKCLNAMKKFVP